MLLGFDVTGQRFIYRIRYSLSDPVRLRHTGSTSNNVADKSRLRIPCATTHGSASDGDKY